MIEEYKDYPANGMTYKTFVDPRPRFIQLLDFFNNFWFGFLLASFFWVWPFWELAQMIGDVIALHCGAK